MPGFNIPFSANDTSCQASDVPKNNQLNRTFPKHTVETVRANRYSVEIITGLESILIYANKVQRPVREFTKMTIHNGLEEIYRPGKYKWQPITISFYEVIESLEQPISNTSDVIYKWINGDKGVADISRSIIGRPVKTNGYMKDITIAIEDGGGRPVWKYQLFDVWPELHAPDELDYSLSDIRNITLTLSYNKAVEINPNEANNNAGV